jgi:NAD(P)-dependent dehydrogenase (short-subunit alcohol dehydrogenase family)
LVNNAGANWGESIDSYPDSAFDKVLTLNLRRVFTLTQKLLPLLETAGTPSNPSRVINIGSINGINQPALSTYAYSASKAGLHQLSRHLAAHLAERNITVNAIAPGLFDSKMTKGILTDSRDIAVQGIPLNRIGEPEDIAGACLFLSSRAGAW